MGRPAKALERSEMPAVLMVGQDEATVERVPGRGYELRVTSVKPLEPASDPVEHPAHYTFGKYEVIDVLEDWFPREPLLWQTGKYIARAAHKGKMLEDLKKARFYLDRRIARLEAEAKGE